MNIRRKVLFAGISSVVAVVYVCAVFTVFEPASVDAVTNAVTVTLNVTSGVSISAPGNTSMNTPLTVSQTSTIGTTTWNVATNDDVGYTLTVQASTAPAMQQSATATVSDYQTGAPNTWVATTSNAYFGYGVFGSDVPTGTWGNNATTTTACSNQGANATSSQLKYKGFTTSGVTVASRTATTTPVGINTTICYAVEQNNFYIPSGTYTATITATATGN